MSDFGYEGHSPGTDCWKAMEGKDYMSTTKTLFLIIFFVIGSWQQPMYIGSTPANMPARTHTLTINIRTYQKITFSASSARTACPLV